GRLFGCKGGVGHGPSVWQGKPAQSRAICGCSVRGCPHISGGRTTSFQPIIRGDDPAESGGFVIAWAILFVAGLMEVGWAIGLKYTEGFSRLVPSVLTLACVLGSIILLRFADKSLPIGTAKAVWIGISTDVTPIEGI